MSPGEQARSLPQARLWHLRPSGYEGVLLGIAVVGFLFVALLHACFLYQARQQYRETSDSLEIREQEFFSKAVASHFGEYDADRTEPARCSE
jgi:hypothetical protein